MIAPNGDIYEARPVEYEPESNTKYELAGNLGIELMGDFEKQRPSVAQLESTARLTAWLMKEHAIDFEHVRTHRDAAKGQTSCPGHPRRPGDTVRQGRWLDGGGVWEISEA